MDLLLQIKINREQKLKQYLRENSYWYKYLNRSPYYFKDFEKNMKNDYKLNPTDKINKIVDNVGLINSFLDVLK